MAFDTDNKVTIISGSTSAEIATTYLASANAHYQNVMIVDQSGLNEFGTDPFPMYLTDNSGIPLSVSSGSLSVQLAGSSTVNSIIVGQSLDTVIVAGKAGATAIAVTADNFRIRGLSAATDSISVYGVQGATAVGITASNLQIRGLTAETDSVAVKGISGGLAVNMLVHGISGATGQIPIGVSADALKVFLTNSLTIGGEVGVTAYNLHTRYLNFGTFNDAAPGQSYDAVRVAGFSGAYPVAMALYGISGNSWTPVGVTGSKLQVDIGQLTLTGGTFNIDMSAVGITGVVSVKGSDTATAPLWISGTTGAGGALAVTGAGVSGSIRIEGFTWGTAVGITASNLQIRGLTYGATTKDWVGISGDVAVDVDMLATVVGDAADDSTSLSMYGKIQALASDILLVKNSVGNGSGTAIQTMLTNAIVSPASATTQVRVQIDKIAAGLNASDRIPVSVENMAQPTSVFSGQLTVTVAAQTLPSNTLKSGVTVKALSTNTESIFIGVGSNVTVSNGYELSAGEGIFLEVSNTNNVGVISATSNGQKVCFMAS
jgi:hypothetical protein